MAKQPVRGGKGKRAATAARKGGKGKRAAPAARKGAAAGGRKGARKRRATGGGPRIEGRVTLALAPALISRLDALARARGARRAEVCRALLIAGVESAERTLRRRAADGVAADGGPRLL